MRTALIALIAAGCAAPSNDGDRGELSFRGDEQPLPLDRPAELFVNRAGGEIRQILEAHCDDDACITFIVDDEEIDVTAHVAGLTSITVKVELDDGAVVEDGTYLPFVDP